jgi:hypothetical protein
MCHPNPNTDTEGFRFWKQAWWQNHLAGKHYHISALYVVDLVKFRELRAGDKLREQVCRHHRAVPGRASELALRLMRGCLITGRSTR